MYKSYTQLFITKINNRERKRFIIFFHLLQSVDWIRRWIWHARICCFFTCTKNTLHIY